MLKLKENIRCQSLDNNGKQCRKMAVISEKYFGNSEIYGYLYEKPGWVKVNLCENHRLEK